MVLINGMPAFSGSDDFVLAAPEEITSKGDNMQRTEQGKSKREQRDLRVLQEFMEANEFDAADIKKLLKQLEGETEDQGTDERERAAQKPQSESNLSEDAAVDYLVNGNSRSRDDAAVNQLLGRK